RRPRLAPGGGAQPPARVRSPAVVSPVLQCLDERVLHGLSREGDVARARGQRRPDPRGFPPVRALQLRSVVHPSSLAAQARLSRPGRPQARLGQPDPQAPKLRPGSPARCMISVTSSATGAVREDETVTRSPAGPAPPAPT